MAKTKKDNDVIDRKDEVYVKNETKLHDQSDRIRSITKTKQDNNVTDLMGPVYIEIET